MAWSINLIAHINGDLRATRRIGDAFKGKHNSVNIRFLGRQGAKGSN